MNLSELHIAFKLEADKTGSLNYPSFEPEEIDYWLNKAYLALVNQKMFGNNPRGEGFDQSQKREDDIRNLILTTSVTPITSSAIVNGLGVNLTDLPNYLYFISSRTIFSNGNQAVNLNISHNEKDKFVETAINIPWIKHPVVYIEGGNLIVLYDRYSAAADSYTTDLIEVTYLRKPEALSINTPSQVPIISEHVHQEIVDLAVYLAIENISSPRVQTSQLTLNKLE